MIDDIDIRCDLNDKAGLLAEIRRRDKIIHALMNQVQRNLNNPNNDFSLLQTTFMLEEEVKQRTQELESALDALAGAKEALEKTNSELEERVAERTAELSQQLHFVQQLIEAIPGPVFYKDAQARYLGCNSAFEAFIGLPACELIGKTPNEVFPPESAEGYLGADRALLDRPGSQIYETRVRYANGEMRDVMFHKATFTRPDGTLGGIVGLILDITELKTAEASVRKSQQLLQDIVDNSTALICVKDMSGRFLLLNRRMEELLRTGFSASEAIREIEGKTEHDLFPKDRADACRDREQQVLATGEVMETEESIPQADGQHTYIVTRAPLRDEQGRLYAIGTISTDITERKHLEEQLREAQKMEAMGQLAGGIAHDFNNLMTIIVGYGELLRDSLEDHPAKQEKVEQILRAGEQANSLTRQLLAFTRRQMLQPRLWDLRSVVADMEQMLRRAVSEDIELAIQNDPEPCLIHADRGQIQQVILNLLFNARDATGKGGSISLSVRNVVPENEGMRLSTAVQSCPYVCLKVSDTGHGMDAATKARIFEPFFTTKEVGKGTGMGLATVYGIVRQSGGHIAVESEIGRGATFYVYFQRTEGSMPEERRAVPFEMAPGSETIMVVEDQDGLRTLICEVLRRSGYTVLPAGNGYEALLLAGKHSGRIGLMITDLVMPVMGGREVVEAIPASHPETQVLYMSGYADNISELLGVGHAFIEKPFTPDALLRKVREVFDRKSGIRRSA
jgi:PAS domain S-box-containing protein